MESTSQATWEVLMSKIYGPFARSMPPVTAFNRRVDYGWYTLKARPHSPLSDSASAEAQYVSRGTLMESADHWLSGSRCYREDCGEVNAAHWHRELKIGRRAHGNRRLQEHPVGTHLLWFIEHSRRQWYLLIAHVCIHNSKKRKTKSSIHPSIHPDSIVFVSKVLFFIRGSEIWTPKWMALPKMTLWTQQASHPTASRPSVSADRFRSAVRKLGTNT